jgi:hypothetical protein
MAGFIFGSGVDQLANQRNVADQENIGLAQSDQQARQRAIDIGQQRQIEAQQRAQAEQDAQFQFQQQQAAHAQADQQNDFRFNLGRQDQAAAAAEDKRRFDIGAKQTQQQIDAGKGQNDYVEAVNAIESGDITNPDDLTKGFPSLTPTQKQRAVMYLSMKTKKQGQDYQSVAAAANAATGIVNPPPPVAPPAQSGWNRFWHGATPAAKAPAPLTEDEAMGKLASDKNAIGLRKFLPALTWDEANQRFMPAIPKPEGWMPNSVAPAAATSPQPSAPGTGAAGSFAFNNTAPQPTSVTAGPQPLSPQPPTSPYESALKRRFMARTPAELGTWPRLNNPPPHTPGLPSTPEPGTIYKGYMFQGGDPSNRNNWTQVPQTQ